MITLFLADDDSLFLNRITGFTNWTELGYEIIGQARNGKECLHLVTQLKPDILILDIDMPLKNGVEVSKALKEMGSKIKILIISNYDNFSFVRDAMKYGAYDYLLKHEITPSVLTGKLAELCSFIKQEGAVNSRISFLSNMANRECLKYLIERQTYENDSLSAEVERFAARPNVLGIMQITNFILVTHFSSKMNREKLISSIENLANNIFKTIKNGVIIHIQHGQFVICYHYETFSSTQKMLEQAASNMRLLVQNIHKLFGLTALWQIGDVVEKPKHFHTSYQQILTQLEVQPIPNPASAVSKVLPSFVNNKQNTNYGTHLENALQTGDIKKLEEILSELLHTYNTKQVPLPQALLEQILLVSIQFLKSHNLHPTDHEDISFHNINFSYMNGYEIFHFLMDYFKKIIEITNINDVKHYSVHVKQTIKYIREHYSSDISLSLISSELGITSSHLSHIFKRETGVSFIDYLIDFRIDRAKILINKGELELKEIAEKTGFNGYNYFLKVYKDRTGKTPSQEKALSP